jgi:sarcosine oxidase
MEADPMTTGERVEPCAGSTRPIRYDVAVVGLGIMGSAVAYRLAREGLRVVGLERFWPAHDRGSSSGHTRLFRRAHFEHPGYLPLALRAEELWAEVESATSRALLLPSEALVLGSEASPMIRGSREAAAAAGLGYRALDHAELGRLYPALRVRPDEVGLLEEGAGILLAERCVAAYQALAVDAGAELRFGARVASIDEASLSSDGPVQLVVEGETLCAERVVLTAGPWTSALLPPGLGAPALMVERVLSYFLEPSGEATAFDRGRLPVVLWDHPREPICVFPRIDASPVKIAFHHNGVAIEPDALRREPTDDELASMRAHVEDAVPALARAPAEPKACMYTSTSDGHFAIGALAPGLFLVAACSGHGFKFAPVVGEIVADLVARGETRHPRAVFDLERPSLRR